MPTVDFETAIRDFLELGRRLYAAQPVTGQRVLDELVAWYSDVRIAGAELDDDGDMLLWQWGAIRPLILSEPTDLRHRDNDDELQFADEELQYLDFTRQVFPAGDDEEADFDDAAVQLSITLCFGPADGNEPNANQWIETPADIPARTKKVLSHPFVRSLMSVPTGTLAITVDHCG